MKFKRPVVKQDAFFYQTRLHCALNLLKCIDLGEFYFSQKK